jgi:mono/diheme cytochrome c family protein
LEFEENPELDNLINRQNPCDNSIQQTSMAYNISCANCHGVDGLGVSGMPNVAGAISFSEYKNAVRTGPSIMPAFSNSNYTDSDIENDYYYFQKMNGCVGVNGDSTNNPPNDTSQLAKLNSFTIRSETNTISDGQMLNPREVASISLNYNGENISKAELSFDDKTQTSMTINIANLEDGFHRILIRFYNMNNRVFSERIFTFNTKVSFPDRSNELSLYSYNTKTNAREVLSNNKKFQIDPIKDMTIHAGLPGIVSKLNLLHNGVVRKSIPIITNPSMISYHGTIQSPEPSNGVFTLGAHTITVQAIEVFKGKDYVVATKTVSFQVQENDVMIPVDKTAPVLTITSPALNTILPVGSKTLKLTAKTSENAICTYDNSVFNTFDMTGQTSHEHIFTNLENGVNYLKPIICFDAAGNGSNIINFTFKVRDDVVQDQLLAGFNEVMGNHCLGCHGEFQVEELLFDPINKYVVKGKPNESKIYLSLIGTPGVIDMPPQGPLSASEIDKVRQWIASLKPDQEADILAPSILSTNPSGNLMAGVTSTTLQVLASEKTECRYTDNALYVFDQMIPMQTTDQINHSTSITGLSDNEYTYYFICKDLAENISSKAFTNFKIGDLDLNLAAREILNNNCMSCHGSNNSFAGLNIEDENSLFDTAEKFIVKGVPEESRVYLSLIGANNVSQMPPGDVLSEQNRKIVYDWIKAMPKDDSQLACDPATDNFSPLTRRLTQAEIRNSFYALLGRNYMPDLSNLPKDGKSRYGMTRNGASQGGYSVVATELLYNNFNKEIKDFITAKDHAVFSCEGQTGNTLNNCLNANLFPLVERAWRRLLTSTEKAQYYEYFLNKSFNRGIETALMSTMMSPRFLFISYDDNIVPRKLNNFEIAERLAFLVTARVPTQETMDVARTTDLTNKANLLKEMYRLFDMENTSNRSDLRRNFGWHFYLELQNQWLELDKLSEIEPNVNTTFSTGQMMWANMFFIEEMFRKNRTISQMFTDNFVVATKGIDHLYDADFEAGVDAEYDIYLSPNNYRKITMPESQRKGLLTQAAILAVNAHANSEGEVNPTFRGLWHAGNIVCELPDGVPADVALGEDLPVGVSLKKKMEAHMEKGSSCIGCHKIMDPIGFGLWGFDPLGQTRTVDTWGFEVDPSGELEGQNFQTAAQMIDILAESKKVETCVMSHLTSYIVSHDVDSRKSCSSQKILNEVNAKNGGLKDILEEIVTSDMFIRRK